MELQLPLADQWQETAFQRTPLGPSSRSVCRVLNSGSCGSGGIVGHLPGGGSLVLTNAHVAGTRLGRVVRCQFPFLEGGPEGGPTIDAEVILAAYSDQVMMDWAILKTSQTLSLPAVKLAIVAPTGRHYTGGYPRCEGPWFQAVDTKTITHNGTVWRWQPNSIGGQSGSPVHSFADHLQYGLLTWSWGGDGAGQTARAIWFQATQRAAVGFAREPGMIELADNRADDLENGFFAQTNIQTLPIWAHLDTPTPPPSGDLAKLVLAGLDSIKTELGKLAKAVGEFRPSGDDTGGDTDGPTFGL